jgi:ZIP family zinc transporter
MFYISFVEIFFKGQEALVEHYGDSTGYWVNVASFFGGMLLIGLIDNFIPEETNPHEIPSETDADKLHGKVSTLLHIGENSCGLAKTPAKPQPRHEKKLLRMGLFTALAIGIHNFLKDWPRFWRRWRIRALASPLP